MKTALAMYASGPAGREPLVWLHGFMGRAASFEPVIGLVAEQFHCIGVDLPGHGASRFSESSRLQALKTFEEVAELVLEDLSAMGIRQFSLYGYSMGGRLAQQIALQTPERVNCLILESAAFGIPDEKDRQGRYDLDRSLFDGIESREQFDAFLRNWHTLPLFSTLPAAVVGALMKEKARNPVPELRRALVLMSVGRQSYFLPLLKKLDLPIAFFFGSDDAKYQAIARAAAAELPGAFLRPFKGASHNVHAQFPAPVAQAVVDLIKG